MKIQSPQNASPPILPPSHQRAFTLIELLTVIAVIGILAAIMIPTVGKVRGSAHRANCASNLRQIGMAILSYATDNRDTLPWGYMDGRGAWSDQGTPPNTPPLTEILVPVSITKEERTKRATVFKCPSTAAIPDSVCSYASNCYVMGYIDGTSTYPLRKLSSFTQPSLTVVISEKNVEGGKENTKWFEDKYRTWKPEEVLIDRHSGKGNFLYLDAHVALKSVKDLTQQEIKGQ